jgi:alpha-methylacyl-CoA racemase
MSGGNILSAADASKGPLHGIRIIEIASIGPGPFCGMMLADHGAELIRIERPGGAHAGLDFDPAFDVMLRNRTQLTVDLKTQAGREQVLALIETADGLIEGFRPGVMERLGLGPEAALALNPRLIYGRMTGWGQHGPLSRRAGHDINYIALSGALSAFGRAGEKPTPPINILGDFGGGGLMLAFGMVSALLAVKGGGVGRVVDCAITEGSSALMTMLWSLRAAGIWNDRRGANTLDTGAPYYDTYETSDGKYVAVGAIEPQFYAMLLDGLGCADDPDFARRDDPAAWPMLKEKFAGLFRQRTRDEWDAVFRDTDACVTPVLDFEEAPLHPHNRARGAFEEHGGLTQPAAAPRYEDRAASVDATAPGTKARRS